MPRSKSCACNWEYVGATLGSVWFRGKMQRFVAVKPDGSVLGANYRTRPAAVLGLVVEARRREGLGRVLSIEDFRARGSQVGAGIASMFERGGLFGG